MFPTSGYFKNILCPYFALSVCERPNCHFKHQKPHLVKKTHGTAASTSQPRGESFHFQRLRYFALLTISQDLRTKYGVIQCVCCCCIIVSHQEYAFSGCSFLWFVLIYLWCPSNSMRSVAKSSFLTTERGSIKQLQFTCIYLCAAKSQLP